MTDSKRTLAASLTLLLIAGSSTITYPQASQENVLKPMGFALNAGIDAPLAGVFVMGQPWAFVRRIHAAQQWESRPERIGYRRHVRESTG